MLSTLRSLCRSALLLTVLSYVVIVCHGKTEAGKEIDVTKEFEGDVRNVVLY